MTGANAQALSLSGLHSQPAPRAGSAELTLTYRLMPPYPRVAGSAQRVVHPGITSGSLNDVDARVPPLEGLMSTEMFRKPPRDMSSLG